MNGRAARASKDWQDAKAVWDNAEAPLNARLAAMAGMAKIEADYANGVRA